jgi:hypothetical protein
MSMKFLIQSFNLSLFFNSVFFISFHISTFSRCCSCNMYVSQIPSSPPPPPPPPSAHSEACDDSQRIAFTPPPPSPPPPLMLACQLAPRVGTKIFFENYRVYQKLSKENAKSSYSRKHCAKSQHYKNFARKCKKLRFFNK